MDAAHSGSGRSTVQLSSSVLRCGQGGGPQWHRGFGVTARSAACRNRSFDRVAAPCAALRSGHHVHAPATAVSSECGHVHHHPAGRGPGASAEPPRHFVRALLCAAGFLRAFRGSSLRYTAAQCQRIAISPCFGWICCSPGCQWRACGLGRRILDWGLCRGRRAGQVGAGVLAVRGWRGTGRGSLRAANVLLSLPGL